MSHNAVQPIETSHYTYDAHKSPATNNNKQDSAHHPASSTTAQPAASKIHPVVEKPVEHAQNTTAVVAAAVNPTQHPHTAEKPHPATAVERPHAVAEHAQSAVVQHPAVPAHPTSAVVASKDKEAAKHPPTEAALKPHPQAATVAATAPATAKPHPHVAFEHPEHPIVTPKPSHSSSPSRPAAEHIEDKQQHHKTTESEPHHHPHNHHNHNRSHNHPSQHDAHEAGGEQPIHKHDYTETPHPAHHSIAASRTANSHANDVLIPSDSILSESPLANSSGGTERRQSWSKDEMKRGVMESLLEKEGKKKGAKGGYSSTSPGH